MLTCVAFLCNAKVNYTLEHIQDGVIVTYDFSDLKIEKKNGKFYFTLPGFSNIHEENRPNLLYRNESFVIPAGYKVESIEPTYKIDTYDGDCSMSVPFEKISLSTIGGEEKYDIKLDIGFSDNSIQQPTSIWPESFVEKGETTLLRNVALAKYSVYPIRYDFSAKKIQVCKELSLTIKFSPNSNECDNPTVEDYRLCSTVATLPIEFNQGMSMASVILPQYPEGEYILIVCPYYFLSEAEKFANWKNIMGFNTKIISLSDNQRINPEIIHNLIKNEYSQNSKIRYIAILGDGSQVRPFAGTEKVYNGSSLVTYYTDYTYGCLNQSRYQTIPVGRFPASSLNELSVMIRKSIDYEKNPCIGNYAFQLKNYQFSEFDVLNRNSSVVSTKDKSYFIWVSEYVRNLMTGYSLNPKHMIYVPKNAKPATYPNDVAIPSEMWNNGAVQWNATSRDLIDAFNGGASSILLRGHGNVNQFSYAGFTTAMATNLTNNNKLPVVFDISCQNGMFYHPIEQGSKTSLMQALLQNSSGGAVAGIGANQLSWQIQNSYLVAAIYQYMYPSVDGLGFTVANPENEEQLKQYPELESTFMGEELPRLGDIFYWANNRVLDLWESNNLTLQAYTRMNQENFHCLGDPTLVIQKNAPVKKKLNITFSDGRYYYNDLRRLVGKNKTTGKVVSMPYVQNQDITDLISRYDLSCPALGYVPEIVDQTYLQSLTKTGIITAIMKDGGQLRVEYDVDGDDGEIVVLDLFGNILNRRPCENNSTLINDPSGFSIVTLQRNGEILDSKVIN